ncbi:L,D-transpeptidase [Streptomyces sp. N2-109]|uniref:L,D-transpeptidase n=1 Tax=Streptomyces gossypii TaxID=2883101 RepID=A0ABT2JX94_9ACTN|nr:L,D-transpeptidase [Streptomyces gossypii]MCT2592293.1 L,D-transpeptidase [Streptomyces gossypii]
MRRTHGEKRLGAAVLAAVTVVPFFVLGGAARAGAASQEGRQRAAKPACTRWTGPYQRKVEGYLKLKVDGRQSRSDCLAIQKYQTNVGIHPNNGFAGPTTWKVMTLRWARKHPYRLSGCPAASGRVICMDLNRQLLWVRKGERIIFKPVPIRTGKPGYETRTGWNRIYRRVRHEHSRLYDAPMPFSQYFNGGQALHGVYDDVYTTSGSHGCVNLEYQDAKRVWQLTRKGDRVYSWGRKRYP